MNYYLAKISVRQCLADIRINDVPVVRKSVDADLTVQVPINHIIEASGQQALSVQLLPLMGSISFLQGAMCTVEIWRFDGSGRKLIPIEQVCSSKILIMESDTKLPYRNNKSMFYAEVDHRIMRWADCVELYKNRQTAEAVGAFFQSIGKMLADRQYDRFADLTRKRETDICTALALETQEVGERNEMLFNILEKGFVWQPMKGSKTLQLYADKRVATIIDSDLKSALKFVNERTEETLAIELLIGKKKGTDIFCVV